MGGNLTGVTLIGSVRTSASVPIHRYRTKSTADLGTRENLREHRLVVIVGGRKASWRVAALELI